MLKEIKNCPFCGGKAEVTKEHNLQSKLEWTFVICSKCEAQGKPFTLGTGHSDRNRMDYAILHWNERV